MPHTPGPWEIDDDTLDVIALTIGDAPAYIACQPAYPAGRPLGAAEVMANVRLIACAPEMLGALKRIAHKQLWGDGAFSVAELCNSMIAKAEGRE
jgi:hypothetical protein